MTEILTDAPALPTHLQTVEEFEQWERQHVPEGNYEFVWGRIILKEGMKQNEVSLANFLLRKFIETQAFRSGHVLMPESDSYVDEKRRRIPDLTYFTEAQLTAIRRGERVSTLFAIEILSESESHEDVLDKIQDYFDGGAQLVWYIVPKRRKIYAYTAPDILKMHTETDEITATPVVSDFRFTVADLFV